MEYGLSCFLGLHVKALSLTHVLACYSAVFASTCIGVHSSILVMTCRGTDEFCARNIGLKGYWGLLKETGMFSFFTPLLSIILLRKSFPFLKITSKCIVCASDWLCHARNCFSQSEVLPRSG